jgi:cellulose synthase operon protein C
LFNAQEDRRLYSQLMRLGARTDLTVEQRATTRQIWSDWSVRRAASSQAVGETERADDILQAALLAFPENLSVRKATAEGLVREGRAREALMLYKTIPMDTAPATEFEAAVSTALAANDEAHAEQWLRLAMTKFPRDATLLALAGRYEQALGENDRAADYYRAAMAISPNLSPATLLPAGPVGGAKEPVVHAAVTAADLPRLLDPAGAPAEEVRARTEPSERAGMVWKPSNAAESHSAAPIVVFNSGDSLAELPPPSHTKKQAGDKHDGHDADLPPPHVFPPSASQGVSPAPVFVPPGP